MPPDQDNITNRLRLFMKLLESKDTDLCVDLLTLIYQLQNGLPIQPDRGEPLKPAAGRLHRFIYKKVPLAVRWYSNGRFLIGLNADFP